jgi:hypothetical protein
LSPISDFWRKAGSKTKEVFAAVFKAGSNQPTEFSDKPYLAISISAISYFALCIAP